MGLKMAGSPLRGSLSLLENWLPGRESNPHGRIWSPACHPWPGEPSPWYPCTMAETTTTTTSDAGQALMVKQLPCKHQNGVQVHRPGSKYEYRIYGKALFTVRPGVTLTPQELAEIEQSLNRALEESLQEIPPQP